MSFQLENPVQITRGSRGEADPRLAEAIKFATDNRGSWFVYETETLDEGADASAVTRSRARVTQRTARLRFAAKKNGVILEITTRKDGSSIKGYVRAIDEKTGDDK